MVGVGWMIYGAYGYTGRLVTAQAVERGHRPVLAGRSEAPLRAMAQEFDLDYWVVSVDDQRELVRALGEVETVVNVAGPFTHTAVPVAEACIAAKANYVDIAGDVPVVPMLFDLDERAREAGVVILPSAGWDAVPTNCLTGMLQKELPDANWLELATAGKGKGAGKWSRGSVRTGVEAMVRREPVLVRRDGTVAEPEWAPTIRVPFPSGEVKVAPRAWVDLELGYRATGIPNIAFYAPRSRSEAFVRRVVRLPGGPAVMGRLLRRWPGPSASERADTTAYIWGRAWNDRGERVTHVLTTPNGYDFTADCLVRVVERLHETNIPPGTHTPLSALGADFVLECDGVSLD
ncbi:MAG TPA: saccharopine dehydrogenase NADP-binding domain-containing protein [Nocardioidaceae bacterium]|nr:saccharopine dehydrogenase NADP-binding domain-containing protein [Nocardioidaceae bacterium]